MNQADQLALGQHATLTVANRRSLGFVVGLGLMGTSVVWIALTGPDSGHEAIILMSISFAALVSSVAGFAFSAICGALLFHFHDDPVRIVRLMIICSIANQAAMTWTMRHEIDWKRLNIYFAGGVLGLAIGVWILLNMDRMIHTYVLGGFLFAYGSYMFLRRPLVIQAQPVAADFITGFLGGITGGAAGFPGAFVTIWCGMKGWNKTRQRAVVQPFILVMQIAALIAIGIARHSDGSGADFNFTDFLFIPASLCGTSLGLALYQRLSDQHFGRAVNILLIVSGLSYFL